MILVHQTRGTGVGNWEVNYIASYTAGTITTLLNLANTYTDSGASQAQVLVLKQYSNVNISSTLTTKAWDGNVGGITAFCCCGSTTITGTISANGNDGISTVGYASGGSGIGFSGGQGISSNGAPAYQGEGSASAGTTSTSANGNGGGGGDATNDSGSGGGGGGGGHASTGTAGSSGNNGVAGNGGGLVGSADLTTWFLGGGGGGGSRAGTTDIGGGGGGGGIVIIFSKIIDTSAGYITSNGGIGGTSGSSWGYGGDGAGGSIFLKYISGTLGTNRLTATGGTRSNNASLGRIRLEGCSRIGTTDSPTGSYVDGGFSFCGSIASII